MEWLLVIPLLLSAVIAIAYSSSAAAKARRRARRAVAGYGNLVLQLRQQESELRADLKQKANQYTEQIREQRLRNISIEELRRLKSGLRLQPLRDANLCNLAQLQNWNASRLQTLRGVGPSTAVQIASLVASMTERSRRIPIPHPEEPFNAGCERQLVQAVYLRKWFESEFTVNRALFETHVADVHRQLKSAFQRTNFGSWIVSILSDRKRLESGILEANQILADLQPNFPAMELHNQIVSGLTAGRRIRASEVDREVLMRDYKDHHGHYVRVFTESLGPAGTPAGRTAAPLEPVSIKITQSTAPTGRPIPSPRAIVPALPTPSADAKYWIPAGQDFDVGGHVLKGGLLYIGTGLKSVSGASAEPALIDPTLPIAQEANCHVRSTEYWPSYHEISPTARASYLQWLSTGKSDPEADAGYVFLYFYGLERRALSISCLDPLLHVEVNQIEGEIRRLLSIYDGNGSFRHYANSLLDFLAAKRASNQNPQTLPALPEPRRHWTLPFDMRVGLGIFAKENRPVPPEWAIRWYECLANQASAYRLCREQFVELFKHIYTQLHGEGIIISAAPPKLTVLHQAASRSFGFDNKVTVEFNFPDVSAYIGSDDAIRRIGSECSSSLASYGRLIASHPEQSSSIEAVSLLPSAVWPDGFSHHIQELKIAIKNCGGCKVMVLRDLFVQLDNQSPVSKKAYTKLSIELESLGMSIEPDVRIGSRVPGLDQPIALFLGDHSSSNTAPSNGYATASLMVHLAGIVAAAGKEFDDAEVNVILDHIKTEFELTEAEHARLAARLKIFRVLPPSTTGLKKKVDGLSKPTRETIGDFLIHVSLADGTAEPEEVRALETLYALLDVDKAMLYSRLHKAQTGSPIIKASVRDTACASETSGVAGRIRFDMKKVASLRAESEKIAAVLKDVFEEPSPPEKPETPVAEEHEEALEASLLGLDVEHAALLQVLVQRPQWTRAELEQMCQGKNLMVDGAIEHINDACFSRFDCAILEGDDPIDVNCDLVAKEMA